MFSVAFGFGDLVLWVGWGMGNLGFGFWGGCWVWGGLAVLVSGFGLFDCGIRVFIWCCLFTVFVACLFGLLCSVFDCVSGFLLWVGVRCCLLTCCSVVTCVGFITLVIGLVASVVICVGDVCGDSSCVGGLWYCLFYLFCSGLLTWVGLLIGLIQLI